MSVKFLSAILGPEMGAPVLWTPGKMRSFCRKTHVHKIPRFRGGGILGFGGGGNADFIFMGAWIFLINGVSRNYRAIRCKRGGGGVARMWLCETKYQGGYRSISGIVLQYRTIWGH